MISAETEFGTAHFTTDALPERDRVARWREVFGRTVVRLDLEPRNDGPFRCEARLRTLPDVALSWVSASPFRGRRTRELLADSRDDIALLIVLDGAAIASQRGQEAVVAKGSGVLLRNIEAGSVQFQSNAHYINICITTRVLAPMITNLDAVPMTTVLAGSAVLDLLIGYARLLQADRVLANPDVQRVAATHIQDLMALAIGATREANVVATGRGLRAARLRAVKADIIEHIVRRDLSIDAVAGRQRISPSYIRKLFEAEGTTFSQFVLDQRLVRARRLLTDPCFDALTNRRPTYELR